MSQTIHILRCSLPAHLGRRIALACSCLASAAMASPPLAAADRDPRSDVHASGTGARGGDDRPPAAPVSLHSFRGKVVVLAFNDSECTTVCPLTTSAMLDAKAMLGSAGSRVELLGIDANPAAISLEDVWSYSELHGILHAWQVLTGSLPELKRVWKQYAVEAAIERGQITHTPALFVIDPQGRKAKAGRAAGRPERVRGRGAPGRAAAADGRRREHR